MQRMSYAQLIDQSALKWFTKTRLIYIGIGCCLFIGLAVTLSGSKAEQVQSEKVDQLALLLKANESLQETNEILRKRLSAQNQTTRSAPRQNAARNTFVSFEPGQGFQKPNQEKKELYIPRGAVFRARLITSIKTSIQESFVIAETTKVFEMDSKRRIERGSRLIGTASLDRALKGVSVKFDTLVTPKGVQYDALSLLALSERAYPLIEGLYFSDAGAKYGTALAFGFLSGFSSSGMEREATIAGSMTTPSLTNQALGGLSVASFKIAEHAMESLQNENIEHVVVPAGTDIYLTFARKWNIPDLERGVSR
jgi:hypothetical protein